MNKKILIQFCQESKNLLDNRMKQNAKKNKCGFPGRLKHAAKIFEICYWLNAHGKTFYTEAVFKNGSRADIFVLDDCVAIEVMDSEKEKSIDSKKEKYPCRIVGIRVEEKWREELIY